MTKNEQELIQELERDIQEWEEIAAWFESLSDAITIDTESGKQKAEQLRNRIEEWRSLIRRIRESN